MNFSDVKLVKGFTKVIIPFQFDTKEYKKVEGRVVSRESNEFKEKLKLDKFCYLKNDKERHPFVKSELIPTGLVGGLEDMMQNGEKTKKKDKKHNEGQNKKEEQNENKEQANEYLSIFITGDEKTHSNSGTIVDIYEVKSDEREFFSLNRRPNATYKYSFRENGIQKSVNISIPKIRIFLFESNAGFLEIEFEYEDNTIDAETYLSTNYSLSRINHSNSDFYWNKKENDNKTQEITFDIRQLIEHIFSRDIMGSVHNIGEYYVGEKVDFDYTPQVFTYALFDKKPKNIDELLFSIKKNFKGSFKFPNDEKTLNKFSYQVFDNSYWAHSLNVAANISFLTENEATNNFFENDFINRLKSTYYFLYMCVLNQKYGIIIQKGKLSQFDDYDTDYYSMKGELKKVQKYKMEALKFKYKAFFKTPSNEEHINDYYRQLGISKNIQELYTSFMDDLSTNETVYSTLVKKMTDDQEEVAKVFSCERDMFVSLIASVVAICQLLMAKATLIGTGIKWYDILINAILVIIPIINLGISMESKLGQIYALLRDKGADRTLEVSSVEEKKKIIKSKIDKDFKLNAITKFFIFRMVDKDDRKL